MSDNGNDGFFVSENSFLSTDKVALEVADRSSVGPFPAPNNYFWTTDEALIELMILDRHDSLDRANYVDHSPYLDAPSPNTPAFDYEGFSQETFLSWFSEHLSDYEGKADDAPEVHQEDPH